MKKRYEAMVSGMPKSILWYISCHIFNIKICISPYHVDNIIRDDVKRQLLRELCQQGRNRNAGRKMIFLNELVKRDKQSERRNVRLKALLFAKLSWESFRRIYSGLSEYIESSKGDY